MKKLPFLIAAFLILILTFPAQAQLLQKGRGAANVQELSQAVFNALQQNQFAGLHHYIPEDDQLRILKRRSSEDMQLLLEKTTPETLQKNLQTDFNNIQEKATLNTLNWQDWQPSDTKSTRLDRKNPLLYRVEINLSNATGQLHNIVLEAVRVRGRYFLFKQMVLQP